MSAAVVIGKCTRKRTVTLTITHVRASVFDRENPILQLLSNLLSFPKSKSKWRKTQKKSYEIIVVIESRKIERGGGGGAVQLRGVGIDRGGEG